VAQQSCRRFAYGHAGWLRGDGCAIAQGRSPSEGLNCYGNVLTAWRTANPPMTPDGEVEPRVAAMGSMWAFRSRLRSVPYAGLSRVRAEPPCTDPYARWCGTRGWLSESVTGTRFCFFFGWYGPAPTISIVAPCLRSPADPRAQPDKQ
jgi:hypothetical protein